MKFQVGIFHMTTTAVRNGHDRAGWKIDPLDVADLVRFGIENNYYVLCAQIEAASKEDVFQLTQNLDGPWSKGPAVVWAAEDRLGRNQRSSMIGDIFLFDGQSYIVAPVGYTPLPGYITELLSDFGFSGRTGTAMNDSL